MSKRAKSVFHAPASAFVLAMLLMLSACGSGARNSAFYEQGLDVIRLMSQITQADEYIELTTGNSGIKTIVKELSAADYSVPSAVYSISIPEDSLSAMAAIEDYDSISDDLKCLLRQKYLAVLMSQINGMAGMEKLAASSVCSAAKTFVDKSAAEDIVYLYTYENAAPVAVTFILGEDGSVSASGSFIMYDGFSCSSEQEIKDFFFDVNVEVSRIYP